MRSPQDRRNNRQNNQRRNNNQNRMPVHSRQFESAGPSGKVKGTPKQLIEKYMSLARDYYSSGDDVNAETCKQFAEHYSRLLGAHSPKQQNNGDKTDKSAEKTESKKIEIEVAENNNKEDIVEKQENPVRRAKKKETTETEDVKEVDESKPIEEAEKPKRRGRPKKKEAEKSDALELPLETAIEDKPKRRGRPKKAEIEAVE